MAHIDKCKYFGYGIGFDMKGTFPTGGFSENVIMFGIDMSSSEHVDSKKIFLRIVIYLLMV